jgi:phage terminase large subunit
MAPTLRIRLPKLRPLQRTLYESMRRWNVWVCHRRFGKSVLCLCILVAKALRNPLPRPRYAYIGPYLNQAKRNLWDYLTHVTSQIPGTRKNESEHWVELPNEAKIYVLGADHPDSLRGAYWDGVVPDEYAQIDPMAWTRVLRPMLADREGWAIKIGTPFGKNHFYDDYAYASAEVADGNPDYSVALHRASATDILSAQELTDARREMTERYGQTAGNAAYLQEFECEWDAPVPGAVYSDELEWLRVAGRIGAVPYDPTVPVETYWDLGWGDSTAIWFAQPCSTGLRLIDYEEGSHLALTKWVRVVRDKPYNYDHAQLNLTRASYERHFAPHDLGNTEYGYGKTRWSIAQEAFTHEDGVTVPGLRMTIVQRGPLEDGIEATRKLLRRCWIDEQACARGLNALRSYQYAWSDAKQAYEHHPAHDWASHGADALRTGAVGLMGTLTELPPPVPPNSFQFHRDNLRRAKMGLPTRSFRVHG